MGVRREAFLPGSKAGVHSSQTEAAYGPDSVGKYDPILHQWIIEPDHQKWQAREREHANEVTILPCNKNVYEPKNNKRKLIIISVVTPSNVSELALLGCICCCSA